MESIEQHLQEHNIKPTAVRILVWREIAGKHSTFSLSDTEEWLPEMDRSSIFRALRLFVEHGILHEINDGSGHQKYCVCRCHESDEHKHLNHIHFTCRMCGRTYCLEEYKIPMVHLPEGYLVEDAEYVMKGICPNCSTEVNK